ncbi:transposase [Micromonospora sp. C51]|uniref:DDE-type integrase/transposase/recombinase n=1 Tax=Micromonospora sp. C51 TaxID=2824879 RepID=UPI001B36F099|nr:DDE-type integrase/transposase/recombinase [Micromonospora sp. C51]MBQ1053151.1 transposase [Micromonospora sp. C51]
MASRRHVLNLLDAQLAAGVRINVAEFAREHGVSVRTVYRHQARIRDEGEWHARSRRPHSSPRVTPPDLDAWICKLRAELGLDNGADFIRDALIEVHAATGPAWRVPSRSTINRVLARHDLLERNPAKRPRSSFRRFVYARPRDCYQIDATNVRLADGSLAAVFDVLDDCTRTLVGCHATIAETAEGAVTAVRQAFGEYGVPAIVLSDNGTAFTSRLTRPGSISTFVQCLLDHNVRPINSSPYHPQTCGKVERHHQTLKKWLSTQPTPGTRAELQTHLDVYRRYYNTERRHSALPRRATPAQAWTDAPSLGGPASLPLQTDATLHRCLVDSTGAIRVAGHRTSVGTTHAGTTVTAIRDQNQITVYHHDGQPLGHFHLTPDRNYISLTRAA